MKSNRSEKGFTLVELVIVIAVIAILAVLLVPTVLGQVERARTSKAISDVNEMVRAFKRASVDTGLPTNSGCYSFASNLTATTSPMTCQYTTGPFAGVLPLCAKGDPSKPCWGGPYMSLPLTSGNVLDPWGDGFYYIVDGNCQGNTQPGAITVFSGGPNNSTNLGSDPTIICASE